MTTISTTEDLQAWLTANHIDIGFTKLPKVVPVRCKKPRLEFTGVLSRRPLVYWLKGGNEPKNRKSASVLVELITVNKLSGIQLVHTAYVTGVTAYSRNPRFAKVYTSKPDLDRFYAITDEAEYLATLEKWFSNYYFQFL